jgi:hypothetical protein
MLVTFFCVWGDGTTEGIAKQKAGREYTRVKGIVHKLIVFMSPP